MKIKANVIERLKQKDEEAFNEIYYLYIKLIYYILYSMVKNHHSTEDLTQEVFIKMYKNIERLNDNNKFHYWFIALAKNTALNFLKKQENITYNDDLVNEYIDISSLIKAPQFEFNGFLDNLENLIVTLHFVHNMTFAEISEFAGKSMSIITKKYYNAIKKLRKQYARS